MHNYNFLPPPTHTSTHHSHTHTTVEAEEIRRLSRSFKRLDLNQNGSLSVDEFLSIPELQQNPLVRRVIDLLDTDGNGEVDFQGKRPGGAVGLKRCWIAACFYSLSLCVCVCVCCAQCIIVVLLFECTNLFNLCAVM